MKNAKVILLIIIICLLNINQISAQVLDNPYFSVYKDTIHRTPKPLKTIPDSDIAYTKIVYRIIDFKDKRNNIFAFTPYSDTVNIGFINRFFSEIQEGVYTAYEDDNFERPLSFEELLLTSPKKAIKNEPLEDTTKYFFTIEDIIQLKLKEIWLLDKDYKVLDMCIIGV